MIERHAGPIEMMSDDLERDPEDPKTWRETVRSGQRDKDPEDLEVVEGWDFEQERALVVQFWHDSLQFSKLFFNHNLRAIDPTTGKECDGEQWQTEMLATYPKQWMLKLFNEVGWFGDWKETGL